MGYLMTSSIKTSFASLLEARTNGTIVALEEYKNCRTKILFRHKSCGHEWYANTDPILNKGVGCPKCNSAKAAASKRLSLSEVNEKVQAIFGKSLVAISMQDRARHTYKFRCSEGHEKVARLYDVLKYDRHCQVCEGAKKLSNTEHRKSIIAKGYKIANKFTDVNVEINFKCSEGHTFTSTPRKVLSTKFICPTCKPKRIKSSHEEYLAKAKANGFEVLEEYKGSVEKLLHRCVKCGTESLKTPSLINHHGCAVCSFDKVSQFKRKIVKLGRRYVEVQGYEHWAIAYFKRIGIHPSGIKVTVAEGKPTIRYAHLRKVRTYIPDFYLDIHRTIVEVKSIYTAGLTKYKSNDFVELQKKARACEQEGFKFKLLLFRRDGSLYKLPSDWVTFTKASLRKELGV